MGPFTALRLRGSLMTLPCPSAHGQMHCSCEASRKNLSLVLEIRRVYAGGEIFNCGADVTVRLSGSVRSGTQERRLAEGRS